MTVPIQNGPGYKQLPLWRDAMRFLVAVVEVAVRQFGKNPSPPR